MLDDVGQPGVYAAGAGVKGGVGAVDGDAGAGEAEEGRLLGVGASEGLKGAEDDWVCGLL